MLNHLVFEHLLPQKFKAPVRCANWRRGTGDGYQMSFRCHSDRCGSAGSWRIMQSTIQSSRYAPLPDAGNIADAHADMVSDVIVFHAPIAFQKNCRPFVYLRLMGTLAHDTLQMSTLSGRELDGILVGDVHISPVYHQPPCLARLGYWHKRLTPLTSWSTIQE